MPLSIRRLHPLLFALALGACAPEAPPIVTAQAIHDADPRVLQTGGLHSRSWHLRRSCWRRCHYWRHRALHRID